MVFFITLWLFLWITSERSRVAAKVEEVSLQIKNQEAEVARLKAEQEKLKQEERKVEISEQDAYQLVAARQMIERKSFSWNRMIGDIEKYIPNDVRLMSIRVKEVFSEGEGAGAEVEFKALGKNAGQMTGMMTSLEKSGGLFEIGQTSQEAPVETGEIPFIINVTYRPSRGGAQ